MNLTDDYLVNLCSSEYPDWQPAHWERAGDINRFHWMRLDTSDRVVLVHDGAIQCLGSAEHRENARPGLGCLRLFTMNATNRKRQQGAVAATLEELRIKLSCAQGYNEAGDPEEALKYVKDIHTLSYVGDNDYKP